MTDKMPTRIEILIPNVTATDIPIDIWNEIGAAFKAMANPVPDDPLRWFDDYLAPEAYEPLKNEPREAAGLVGVIPPEACTALFDRMYSLRAKNRVASRNLPFETDILMVGLLYYGRCGDYLAIE